MERGFQNVTLDVKTGNGLDDTLLEPLEYVSKGGIFYRAPKGGTTDGLSVPRCLQNIIPATGGDWFSGVLHDSAYRNQLQARFGCWTTAKLTRKECDDLILEAMEFQGVNWFMRHLIYWALRMFGGFAFNKDRA